MVYVLVRIRLYRVKQKVCAVVSHYIYCYVYNIMLLVICFDALVVNVTEVNNRPIPLSPDVIFRGNSI